MLVDNFPSFECDSVYVGNGGIFQFLNMLCTEKKWKIILVYIIKTNFEGLSIFLQTRKNQWDISTDKAKELLKLY